MAQAAFADTLTAAGVVRARPGLHRALTAGRIELADRIVAFPAECQLAVAALLSGEPVRVADLPGLDEQSQLVLVRRLLREAIVMPAGL
ncbi:hypothetical protein AB0B66_20780 [Catellatospora sp. NPDC049111]|uniref:hypothetical protein n=1 Tax=Catellatospora sp. NPDC049111 TaxID=3155271 RepID=UPI0033ED31EB